MSCAYGAGMAFCGLGGIIPVVLIMAVGIGVLLLLSKLVLRTSITRRARRQQPYQPHRPFGQVQRLGLQDRPPCPVEMDNPLGFKAEPKG